MIAVPWCCCRPALQDKWLQVYWPDDNRWWPGRVTDINVRERRVVLLYETSEWPSLASLIQAVPQCSRGNRVVRAHAGAHVVRACAYPAGMVPLLILAWASARSCLLSVDPETVPCTRQTTWPQGPSAVHGRAAHLSLLCARPDLRDALLTCRRGGGDRPGRAGGQGQGCRALFSQLCRLHVPWMSPNDASFLCAQTRRKRSIWRSW